MHNEIFRRSFTRLLKKRFQDEMDKEILEFFNSPDMKRAERRTIIRRTIQKVIEDRKSG